MKRFLSVILALSLFLSLAVVSAHAEDITLDVIIASMAPTPRSGSSERAWTVPTSLRSLRKRIPVSS